MAVTQIGGKNLVRNLLLQTSVPFAYNTVILLRKFGDIIEGLVYYSPFVSNFRGAAFGLDHCVHYLTPSSGCELGVAHLQMGPCHLQVASGEPAGFIAATSMNWDGNVMVPAAREMVTWPSSSGWRMVSKTLRLNSGSSSRNNTP